MGYKVTTNDLLLQLLERVLGLQLPIVESIYRMFSQEMLFIENVLITDLVNAQWSSTILNWFSRCKRQQFCPE